MRIWTFRIGDPCRYDPAAVIPSQPTRPSTLGLTLFAAAYVLAGGFGQGLALVPGLSIMFWPPAGIFLAALLLSQPREWRWWIAAGCAAELLCNLIWFHNPVRLALIYFAANAIEAMTGAWLIKRLAPRPFRLETAEEAGLFIALCAIVAPVAGASIIATTDALLGKHPFLETFALVWLGDGSGLLISAPLTFFAVQAWHARGRASPWRLAEAVAMLAVLVLVGLAALKGRLPSLYVMLPPLLWAAVRFELRGAAVSLGLVTVLVAAVGTGGISEPNHGVGLMQDRIVRFQTFLAVSAVCTLFVGALSAQRRRAMEALQASNQDLERRVDERTADLRESDRRKDEFLAILGHELRNPLAPVMNSVEVLNGIKTLDPLAVEARETIHRQITHLVRLVDDLLDLSRITQGKIQLRVQRIDLRDCVRHATELVRSACAEARQTLHVSLPDAPLCVDGDEARVTQMVGNLLTNACRYTQAGGSISLSAAREGDQVVVRVKDTGTGIPPGKLEDIFRMFGQLDRPLERTTGGLGIGLNLVRKLAHLHRGTVSAASEGEGTGSEFTIRLPLSTSAASAADQSLPAKSDVGLGQEQATRLIRRILIADDNVDSARSLARLLKLSGHDTQTAHDGEEAVRRALEYKPDVVLMDIGMPKMNGYDACREIRRTTIGPRPLILAISGWGQDADRRASAEAGFDVHLVKPLNFDRLQTILNGGDGSVDERDEIRMHEPAVGQA